VTMPVGALNPYQNRWTIRARLMEKDWRSYSNARGEGKLFNLTVADASGEIRVTGFNETYDQVYDMLTVGRVYMITGGTLKPKNAQYNQTSHSYEITLNRGCSVEEAEEPTGNEAIPQHNYKFVQINALQDVPEESKADVLAVVVSCTDATTFTAKSGKEMTKRVAELADHSGCKIECTVFGQPTQQLADHMVVAIKAAKVGSWNSKSLTTWSDASILLHPDMPEAHQLMGWWQGGGSAASLSSLSVAGGGSGSNKASRQIVFSDIEDQALGLNGDADFFSVRCCITHIKADRTLWYIACPHCKKKLAQADEMQLQAQCEKCDKTVMGSRRWIFVATCNDASGSRLVSFFDETGTVLLGGKSADELAISREQQPAAFDRYLIDHSFQSYTMKGRVKNEMFQDEAKLKISCTQLTPLDYVATGRALLQDIAALRSF